MRVLLVEDDENKWSQVSAFVKLVAPHIQLEIARSLQSGLRAVRTSPPDLILLDMTLPTYDVGPDEPGGQIHPLGGRQFLAQMDRFDIQVPVVVVTQFETFGKDRDVMTLTDLDIDLRKRYGNIYRGTVYYHAAIEDWKESLRQYIRPSDLGEVQGTV
jgi:CheY-like chemotaxis protein